MTKKDFQQLATMLYEAKITARERQKMAMLIAEVCQRNNPAFDIQKFCEASGTVQPSIRSKD